MRKSRKPPKKTELLWKLKMIFIKANDEPPSWMRRIADIFKGKTYELGDVRDGKIYSVDECVQIALANSPRFEVAEMQIKMAEIRLWEARRGILPTVTGRYEATSGQIGF